MDTAPSIELVVCTHNRADLLQRLLRSIADAEMPELYEIRVLVIANACQDDTRARTLRIATTTLEPRGIRVRIEDEPVPGKSRALNRALVTASGDWLAFVDDDHKLDRRFFTEIARCTRQHPDTQIFCGRILPEWDGTEQPQLRGEGKWAIRPLPVPTQDWGTQPRTICANGPIPGGGNLIVLREFALRNGEFRTEIGPQRHNLSGGEDREWVIRALHNNAILRYEPEIVQWHYVDPSRLSMRYLVAKAFTRSRDNVFLEGAVRGRVPLYLWRKLATHAAKFAFSWNMEARRHYLVRTAATVGEIAGLYRRKASSP